MLTGRVDDFQKGKLYGWCFNTEAPGEHLLIRISFGSQTVASGVASLTRPDLPEAGIGEGDHAFEIMMPPHIVSMRGLVIIAQSARHGEAVLPIASNDERHLDELFQIFSNRYDEALKLLKSEMNATMQDLAELRETSGSGHSPIGEDADGRIASLEKRMESTEVFLVRIDESVRALAEAHARKKPKGIFAFLRYRNR